MSKVKIELNSAGIRELLTSPEMESLLEEQARDAAQRCGPGYGSDTYMTGGRAVSSVFTDSPDAEKDNFENNTLLKGLGV